MLREYFEDESGVTMIEYGLIAGPIGVALIVVLTTLGDTMESVLYGNISSGLPVSGLWRWRSESRSSERRSRCTGERSRSIRASRSLMRSWHWCRAT